MPFKALYQLHLTMIRKYFKYKQDSIKIIENFLSKLIPIFLHVLPAPLFTVGHVR